MNSLLTEYPELFTKASLEKYKNDKIYSVLIKRIKEVNSEQSIHFGFGLKIGKLLTLQAIKNLIIKNSFISTELSDEFFTSLEEDERKLTEIYRDKNSEKLIEFLSERGIDCDQ